jgi:cell division protein ZapA
MKQMEVTILGQSYLLACPEGGEDMLRAAVARVDLEMSAIRDAGKVKARERIAVLAALNLAYLLAENRSASAASTVPAIPASPQSTPLAVGLPAPEADALIDRLIHRLDTTLGQDGQLL